MQRISTIVALVLSATCWLSGAVSARAQRWADSSESVVWQESWGRFGAPHAATVGVALSSAMVVRFAAQPDSPRWRGPFLFDSGFRDAVRAGDATTRRRAGLASDVLLVATVAGPLVDALLVAWWQRDAPNVAAQLVGMNTLSFAVTAWVVAVSKVAFARERPGVYALNCRDDPAQPGCDSASGSLSFISGHSAMAFTGAALTCIQHRYLGLHGSRGAGATRCALGLAAATTTAALRVAADRHWASDVMFGALVGFAAGWLLPRLVYFRPGRRVELASAPLPYIARGNMGLTYSGAF